MKVFLGGTCNGSTWRDRLIPCLAIDYYNPVVEDWNEEARQRELRERETADFVLYVITPKITGFYAIAEAVDDSNKRPTKTIFVTLLVDDGADFTAEQLKSLNEVANLIKRNGARRFVSLHETAQFLNDAGAAERNPAEAFGTHDRAEAAA